MAKVLVIDDDPFVRKTIGRILACEDYQLIMAEDGREGLELFQREQPDLVITDIIMPDVEGIETIRKIRQMRPAVRIIAISGGGRFGVANFLEVAAKFGAHETIVKPFDPAELLDSVTRCLRTTS